MASPGTSFESLADRERYEKACAGKDQYPSESSADFGVTDIRKNKNAKRRHALHSYKCEFGDHWHIGHEY